MGLQRYNRRREGLPKALRTRSTPLWHLHQPDSPLLRYHLTNDDCHFDLFYIRKYLYLYRHRVYQTNSSYFTRIVPAHIEPNNPASFFNKNFPHDDQSDTKATT